MVIIFNGDTVDLLKRLEQYSGQDQKITLDFMMRNFKIMDVEMDIEKEDVHTYS